MFATAGYVSTVFEVVYSTMGFNLLFLQLHSCLDHPNGVHHGIRDEGCFGGKWKTENCLVMVVFCHCMCLHVVLQVKEMFQDLSIH